MKPLAINFGALPVAMPWWTLLLFVAGLAACGVGVWRFSTMQAELQTVRRDIAQHEELLALRSPTRERRPQFELPAERVRAINRAVGKLNLPWANLFAAIEAAKPETVALLSLEPDAGKRTLKITAETRRSADMLGFVDRLAKRGEFAGVALQKHEISDQDPNRPYRFQLEARWRDQP